jgi:A nuclease family of the HNH/ENDO VII superfamily with conserved AHH
MWGDLDYRVPWELFEKKFDKLPAIQKLVAAGFHPNEFANGLNVAQTVKGKLWNGNIIENVFHGNHPNYTQYVEQELKKISDEFGDNANAIAQEVMNKLLPQLKKKIEDAEKFIVNTGDGWTLDKYFLEKLIKNN